MKKRLLIILFPFISFCSYGQKTTIKTSSFDNCSNNIKTTGYVQDFENFTSSNNPFCVFGVEDVNTIYQQVNVSINTNFNASSINSERVTIVDSTDPLIDFLSGFNDDSTGVNGLNQHGNPFGKSLYVGKSLRINNIPDINNIFSENELKRKVWTQLKFKDSVASVEFDFAAVFEHINISSFTHDTHNQPYFRVGISTNGFSETQTVNSFSSSINNGDTLLKFTTLNKANSLSGIYNDKIRFNDWKTMKFKIPEEFIGKEFTLTFEVSDCAGDVIDHIPVGSLHAAYVYIDNIKLKGKPKVVTPPDDSIIICPSDNDVNIYDNAADDNNCSDTAAWLNPSPYVSSVTWSYSIGGYSNIPLTTTYQNSTGTSNFFVPIYLLQPASGNWNNYYLWVHADITLTSGATCRRSNKRLMVCTGDGNGDPILRRQAKKVKEIDDEGLKIYPNPIDKEQGLRFKGLESRELMKIQILDLNGNVLKSVKPKLNTINTKGLKPGVYVVRFRTINKVIQKKIIIQQ